jgi:hypothetical protein
MNSHIVLFDQKVNYQSDHVSIFFSVIDQTPYPRNFGNLRKVEKPAEKVLDLPARSRFGGGRAKPQKE